jgi:hypothetical protein
MILGFILIGSILIIPQIYGQEVPSLNIPPTNAFDKIYADSGKISAMNFSMPFTIKGGTGISTTANNSTHTVTISNSAFSTIQGTYNTTQANNVNKNSNGYQINFINGSGASINVLNSHSGKQVNVTISASGSGGTITGSGTTPQLTYWTGSNTIGSTSNMVWNGNNLGVGTITPQKLLDVNGSQTVGINAQYGLFTRISGGLLKPWFATSSGMTDFYDAGGSQFVFRNQADSKNLMTITDTGNVGIGTITPQNTLDVNGTVDVNGGNNIVYRCVTAGTLPIGALTVNIANCGTTFDTGLRVK